MKITIPLEKLILSIRRRWSTGAGLHKWRNKVHHILAMDLSDMPKQLSQWFIEKRSDRPLVFQDIRSWPVWLRRVMLGLVFITILFGFGVSAWKTSVQALRYQQQETRFQEARYLQMASEVALLGARQDRVMLLEERFGQMLALIPGELENVEVLEQISRVARESGMQLQTYSPEPEMQGDAYVVHPVTMNLTGTFDAIGKFLEEISKLHHLITVDLKIEASPTDAGKLMLNARMKAYRGDPTKVSRDMKSIEGEVHAVR